MAYRLSNIDAVDYTHKSIKILEIKQGLCEYNIATPGFKLDTNWLLFPIMTPHA